MHPNHYSQTNYDPVQEVQELEDCYAQALADEADARCLSLLWDRIKLLKKTFNEEERPGTTVIS